METDYTQPQADGTEETKWYTPLTTVTTASKYLALTLFIALPFIGFWFGMGYEQMTSVETWSVEVDSVTIKNEDPKKTDESLREEKLTEVVALADSPRIITCNPRRATLIRVIPCTSDMTDVDSSREKMAFTVINKAIETDNSLREIYSRPSWLFVSDQRYQVIVVDASGKTGYIVIDTTEGKITDYFEVLMPLNSSDKSIIFIEDEQVLVKEYVFGTERSFISR